MQRIKDFFHYDSWILLLDILAVNLAYFGALVIRFYVNFQFASYIGNYLGLFFNFTPFYTIATIIVFFCFHLYGGMWVYAGLNDMNRIILANAVTFVIQIVGSLIIVGRMPISYYAIGGFLQFLMVAGIRFSYRFIRMEQAKIAKKRENLIPALVVGSGDYGRKVIRYLEENTPFRVTVIAGTIGNKSLDGIPVVSLDEVEEQIKAKGIKAIFIADDSLTKEQREIIDRVADGFELKDFTGYFSNLLGSMPVSSLLEIVEGPVTLVIGGQEKKFETARDAQKTLTQRYEVKRISTPRIELEKGETDESWIKEYKDETGVEVSFF